MKPHLLIGVLFFLAALGILIFSIAEPFSWKQLVVAFACSGIGFLILRFGD